MSKKPLYLVLIGPGIALLLAAARFAMQGSVKLYTEPDKQFYVPDPDLGFKLSGDTYHWLGLDRTAGIIAVGGFLLVAAFLLLRRERKKNIEMKKARMGLWVISPLPLIIPIIALLGGTPPDGARAEATRVAGAQAEGIAAALPSAPKGRYKAIEHEGSIIAAALSGGGDKFEGKFADGIRGHFTGNPQNLGENFTSEIVVPASSIKTGIDLRNEHARGYLKVEEFADIAFRLTEITATSKTELDRRIAFSGSGTVVILGKEIATPVTGTVTELDAAGKQRLGLGDVAALVVNASLSIKKSETPMETGDALDIEEIPITVSLVLTYEGAS